MTEGLGEIQALGTGFDQRPVPQRHHQLVPEIGGQLP